MGPLNVDAGLKRTAGPPVWLECRASPPSVARPWDNTTWRHDRAATAPAKSGCRGSASQTGHPCITAVELDNGAIMPLLALLALLALQDVVCLTQQHGGLSAGMLGGNAKREARRPISAFRRSPTRSTRSMRSTRWP